LSENFFLAQALIAGVLIPFCFFFFCAEQQEELKLIHDKFKQDIYQHLQECKTTLEGLELHQIDFNGTVKKRSM